MRLGIISDIHEDIRRLEEAVRILDDAGCDEMACLGDIVGFSIPSFGYPDDRDAAACVDLVKERCKYTVAGNHDQFHSRKIPENKAGFNYPGDWYELDHRSRKELAGETLWLTEEIDLDSLLPDRHRYFLYDLPEYHVLKSGETGVLLSHFLFPDLTGSTRIYYEAFGPVEDHLDFIEEKGCNLGISGHMHIEGIFVADRKSSRYLGFGEHQLGKDTRWIVGPCVANGRYKNGCMILDTGKMNLQVIPLNTRPRIMQVVDYNSLSNEDQ